MAYNTLPGEATQEGPGEPFAPDTAPASTQPSSGSPFEGDAFTRGPAGPMGLMGLSVSRLTASPDSTARITTLTFFVGTGTDEVSIPVTVDVPWGQDGEHAADPVFSPTVGITTGAPGTDATATLSGSGTSADPYVLSFTIPRGDTGEQGAHVVSASVSNGTLTLTLSDGSDVVVTGDVRGEQGDAGISIVNVYYTRMRNLQDTGNIYTNPSTILMSGHNFFISVRSNDTLVFPNGYDITSNDNQFTRSAATLETIIINEDYINEHELGGEGPPGPSVIIGTPTASSLPDNAQATASRTGSGTSADPYIFNFGIPRGESGPEGEDGVTFVAIYVTVADNLQGIPTISNASTVLDDRHTHVLYFRSNNTVIFPDGWDRNSDSDQYHRGDAVIQSIVGSQNLDPHLLGAEGPQGPGGPQGPRGNSVSSVTVTLDEVTTVGGVYDVSVNIVDDNGDPVTTLDAGSFTAPRGPQGDGFVDFDTVADLPVDGATTQIALVNADNELYRWDASLTPPAWVILDDGGGSDIIIQDDPPTTTASGRALPEGATWLDSSTGRTYIWNVSTISGNTVSQWIQQSGVGQASTTGGTGLVTNTNVQISRGGNDTGSITGGQIQLSLSDHNTSSDSPFSAFTLGGTPQSGYYPAFTDASNITWTEIPDSISTAAEISALTGINWPTSNRPQINSVNVATTTDVTNSLTADRVEALDLNFATDNVPQIGGVNVATTTDATNALTADRVETLDLDFASDNIPQIGSVNIATTTDVTNSLTADRVEALDLNFASDNIPQINGTNIAVVDNTPSFTSVTLGEWTMVHSADNDTITIQHNSVNAFRLTRQSDGTVDLAVTGTLQANQTIT